MSAGPSKGEWLWRVDSDKLLRHAEADITFVYNRLSGETHVLNLVSMAMLDLLAQRPMTLDDLGATFHTHLGVPLEECPPGIVRRLFGELDEVGLVDLVAEGAASQ